MQLDSTPGSSEVPHPSVFDQLATLPSLRRKLGFLLGRHTPHWCRVVMDHATDDFVNKLGPESLDVLEISGDKWRSRPFRTYRNVWFPDYDICNEPLADETFDLIIAEQVLEHVLRPQRALENAWDMLRPGGWMMVTTPFLIRIHAQPYDCSRWTELGLKQLLAEAGFPEAETCTGSWGNRSCVVAHLEHWKRYRPLIHSLTNDPRFPMVVWAFARKPVGPPEQ